LHGFLPGDVLARMLARNRCPGEAPESPPRASTTFMQHLRQSNPTGKSPKVCPALRAKIFRLPRRANQLHNSRHPVPPEGRRPSSQTLGRGAVDAMAAKTNAAVAYGEIVWVRRPGAGVKFVRGSRFQRMMVARKPVTRTKSYKP